MSRRLLRLVIAETFLFSCKQILVKHKEVRILANGYGAFFSFDAKLLCSVYRKSKQHLFNTHLLVLRREYLRESDILVFIFLSQLSHKYASD